MEYTIASWFEFLLSPDPQAHKLAFVQLEANFPEKEVEEYARKFYGLDTPVYGDLLISKVKSWKDMAGLESLYLSGDKLTSLPAEIGKLVGLKYLYLSGNNLTSLPSEIGKLVMLKSLYLRGNNITSLPAEIGRLVMLEHLDLSGNQFDKDVAENIMMLLSNCKVYA